MGICRAAQLAPSVFLASAAGCFELVEHSFIVLLLRLPSRLGRKTIMSLPHWAMPPTIRKFGISPRYVQAIVKCYRTLSTSIPHRHRQIGATDFVRAADAAISSKLGGYRRRDFAGCRYWSSLLSGRCK